MPDRQIAFRKVATRLGGSFEVKTGIGSSEFKVRALVDKIPVKVSATSSPLSASGGQTVVAARGEEALATKMYVGRSSLVSVSFFRRIFMRDVLIGSTLFDERWIINAKHQAHAQAILDPTIRKLIEAVPPGANSEDFAGPVAPYYYDYSLHNTQVKAYTANFERDPDRLGAAIQAVVALAKQPQTLLGVWEKLATALDGTLEQGKKFRVDGSTRIRFPLGGMRLIVAPLMVRTGWRQDRLRTRITAERSVDHKDMALRWSAEYDTDAFGEHAELAAQALADSGAVQLTGNKKQVQVDLDGNVTDAERIIAAASLVALLARADDRGAGPYR